MRVHSSNYKFNARHCTNNTHLHSLILSICWLLSGCITIHHNYPSSPSQSITVNIASECKCMVTDRVHWTGEFSIENWEIENWEIENSLTYRCPSSPSQFHQASSQKMLKHDGIMRGMKGSINFYSGISTMTANGNEAVYFSMCKFFLSLFSY